MTKMSQITSGDVMAFINWVEVVNTDPKNGEIRVKDLDSKQEFLVRGQQLIESGLSADRFTSEKSVTKTEAAEIFITNKNTPMTVVFIKANGQLRTMRCKWLHQETLMGRSMVFEFGQGGGVKQIDHRTIQSIIVGDVRYTVKK